MMAVFGGMLHGRRFRGGLKDAADAGERTNLRGGAPCKS
jgi:hypothetical protein